MDSQQRNALIRLWQSRKQTVLWNARPGGWMILTIARPDCDPGRCKLFFLDDGQHEEADAYWWSMYEPQLSLFG